MSKRLPGFWEPPCVRPDEFAITDSETALDRIAANTPEMAFVVAAQRAQAAGLEYGTSGLVPVALPNSSTQGFGGAPGGGRSVQANFDNIADDYLYRTAQALYNAGSPEAQIELPDGTLAELYPEDMAVLFVSAGRNMDHVDIQTFRSVRGLDDAWEDLLAEAGY